MYPPLLLHVEAYWSCPWAASCYVALREKGVPFDTSNALLDDATLVAGPFREHAITARVPALQHGNFWVAESSAIIEYLEDRFPPPQHARLLPSDLFERARARQVMAWLRSDLHALRDEWDVAGIFYPVPKPPLSRAAQRDVERLLFAAERLVARGATQMFREWSIADLDLAFMLKRLLAFDHPLDDSLRAYVDATWRRPTVCEFTEHSRPPFSAWRPLEPGRRA
jgi:glutathione S-transferase